MKNIVVNGRTKPWFSEEIEHDQVLMSAFGRTSKVYEVATITYSRGEAGKQGYLQKGEKIKAVSEKVRFSEAMMRLKKELDECKTTKNK